MSIDEYITRFTAAAEFERTHGNLQGCLEFRQLAEWLRALQKYDDVLNKIRAEIQHLSRADSKYNKVWMSDVLALIDKYKAESEVQE